ncbi:MAG: sugar-binding transcriptional regulator [Pseudomonadota bacterium]
MGRLPRSAQIALSDTASLRMRAAWLYFHGDLTQKEIAETLGVSRSTVVRMLDEARKRDEVQIWINAEPGDCTELAVKLEEQLGLDEVIVVPGDGDANQTARNVGAALGQFLSDVVTDGMSIGVGWGRTVSASLATFRPQRREGAHVVSLLGGLLETSGFNPTDVSWRVASRLGADCSLYLAPLIVDSHDTKQRLIEKCGLDRVEEAASQLDLAILSCGDIGVEGSSLSHKFLTSDEYQELLQAGAICDTLCQFLDAGGQTVDHPVHDRVMAVDLDTIAKAGHVVLASGGERRASAIRATVKRTACRTLITDEAAVRALLDDQSADK